MKKLMIAILILVPIVILLATGVATSIITTTVYINVERVELNQEDVSLSLGVTGEPVRYESLKADVYPTGARNKTVIWTIEDVQFDDPRMEDSDTPIATVDENGVVTAITYGVFSVVATTEDGNKIDTCRFVVSGNNVTSLSFAAGMQTAFNVGETEKLEAVVYSVDAEDKSLNWTASGTAFSVDENGIVRALAEGSSVITATSVSNPDVSASIELSCRASVFKFSELATSSTTIALSQIVNGTATDLNTQNCTISGSDLVVNAYPATVSKNGQTLTITSTAHNAITVFGVAYFTETEFFLRVGGQPIYLNATYADGLRSGTPSVSFTSSMPAVATVSADGTVTALQTGETTVRVSENGTGEYFDLLVKVITPTTRVALDSTYTASRNKLGIAQERVFGTAYPTDGEEVTYSQYINLSAAAGWLPEAYVWTTSDSSIAWFDNDASNKLNFTSESFSGKKTVTMTVSARYPLYESVTPSASYTFTLVDGVNVDTLDETTRYAAQYRGLVLHADIGLDNAFYAREPVGYGDYGSVRGLHIFKCLYGNGHAVYRVLSSNDEVVDFSNSVVWVSRSDVVVENTTIRFGITDDAVSREKGTLAYVNHRWALRIAKEDYDENGEKMDVYNVRINFCTIENAYNCAITQHAEAFFNGCIFRNSPSACLLLYSAFDPAVRNTDLTNCVFSNSTCVPICTMIDNSRVEPDITFGEIPERYGFGVSTISFHGFLDVYNWMDGEAQEGVSLFTVNDSIASAVGMDAELLQGIIDTLLTHILRTDERYKPLHFNIDNHLYFHAGAVIMGGNLPVDPSIISGAEEVGYLVHEVPIPEFVVSSTGYTHPVYLMCYNNETYDVSPDDLVDYSENSQLFSDLRNGREKA